MTTQSRTSHDLRRRNVEAVLDVLRERGPSTRNQIAAATGLHRSTVSGALAELLDRRLVEDGSRCSSARGRPASSFKAATGPATTAGLGLEIREDSLVAVAIDDRGTCRFRATTHAPYRIQRAAVVLDELARLAGKGITEIADQGLAQAGVVVAGPGEVDTALGLVSASEFAWTDVRVRDHLRARLPSSHLTIGSARSLAALAESAAPEGPRERRLLFLTGDGDVAARLIDDGRLLSVDSFGHITVDPNGPACRCGRRGCLQIRTRRAALLHAAGLGDGQLEDLIAHARAGHLHTLHALEECALWLGAALANCVNLLAPDAVVLGEDFAAVGQWLIPALQDQLNQRVIGASAGWPTVHASRLGPGAAALGAAFNALASHSPAPAANWHPKVGGPRTPSPRARVP